MEQRRFLIFFVLSMGILFLWTNLVVPVFFPKPPLPPAQEQANEDAPAGAEGEGADNVADANPDAPPEKPADEPAGVEEAPAEVAQPDDKQDAPREKSRLVADWNPDEIERRLVTIGSLDPASGYFMEVELTSEGAGIERLRLNDPRYKSIDQPGEQLELVGRQEDYPPALATVFQDAVEMEMRKEPLKVVEWQVARDSDGNELIVHDPKHNDINQAVTFRAVFEDLGVEVRKTFRLQPSEAAGKQQDGARESWAGGYELVLQTQVRNLTDEATQVAYQMQGPLGLPLENRETERRFRQVAMGFVSPDGDLSTEILTASALIDLIDDNRNEIWTQPIAYLGIDLHYFAALLVPKEPDQIAFSQPMVAERDPGDVNFSDISVLLTSANLNLLGQGKTLKSGTPGDQVTHEIKLFAGPKREALLTDIRAGSILDYGTMGALAGLMLIVLNFLHGIGLPYGIAIIVLTMIVRSCLFPISRKQALGAAKMKEIQPKLQELKKKYGKDKEKMARAQMELFRKHNYNPLSGCLPILLQLPIFISLYTALGTSIDLRLAPFLWIDNLAAPDNLFDLPFALPFIGNSFNLLPILTIVLFIVQQKMFMPPPANEEQEMQFKMMKVMMVVMGFLFYNVPSGLCLYFIASSLWGIGEKKLLEHTSKPSGEGQPVPAGAR